ncbi:MAG: hypothetical protein WCI74_05775 [Actinomycetes bacterium]
MIASVVSSGGAQFPTYTVSPAAVRTLTRTFWGAQGWRQPGWPPQDQFARAVADGVMFREPRALDHDGRVASARNAVAASLT